MLQVESESVLNIMHELASSVSFSAMMNSKDHISLELLGDVLSPHG